MSEPTKSDRPLLSPEESTKKWYLPSGALTPQILKKKKKKTEIKLIVALINVFWTDMTANRSKRRERFLLKRLEENWWGVDIKNCLFNWLQPRELASPEQSKSTRKPRRIRSTSAVDIGDNRSHVKSISETKKCMRFWKSRQAESYIWLVGFNN